MADIYSSGQKSTDALSGGLKFEQDNNRIIGRDENGIPNLIISNVPSEAPLIEISIGGNDVLTCTDDKKIMTSKYQNLFSYAGPENLTLNYLASTGTITGNMTTLIPFTDIPSTPSLRASLIDVDDLFGNIRYPLPYHLYTAAGVVEYYIYPFIAAGPSYWTAGITVKIPTTSSYYAGNHKFEFVMRITNI